MEDVAPYQEKLDLNFAMNKGEQVLESYDHENHTPKNVMQADPNKENSGSPVHQDFVNNEGDPITNVSTADGSCFAVESNMYTDDIDGRRCGDHADGTMAIEDGHYHDKDDVVECVGVSGNTINDYSTENSDKERVDEEADASSLKQLSAVDNHNDWSVEASDHETKDAHPFDESANEEFGNSQLEKTKLVSQEMDGGSFSPQNEMDEDIRPPRMASSDNGEDNGERYSSRRRSPPAYHSHRRSPRRPWSPPANRNTGIGKPGRNLFVAGFSYVTTERDLEKKFSRFGRVVDVRIVRDKRSGDSRGFGFLSLERDEDADAAIRALDQTEWNNRIILVEKSKTSVR
ncbi:hypothetical protein J5N97_011379 [Dioscorea zingiberensis]|uniref:RRM domain-containing protein n=1 Tax=Dioscorea zingiberensis TaxID=325984 RepID=A0A9D5D228_9LILI|nr:hypothetical protein J5N97_011379 [Dioscorea zingiberensis]